MLNHEHANLNLDILAWKWFDIWVSLQHNDSVYIWVHNGSIKATVKSSKLLNDPVSRFTMF
jgi:hypothetical protein